MEVVDNAFLVLLPGAMEATLTSACSGGRCAALAIAFVVTVPVNHWMIAGARATRWCTRCTVTPPRQH
jgi:hypothetical protein